MDEIRRARRDDPPRVARLASDLGYGVEKTSYTFIKQLNADSPATEI